MKTNLLLTLILFCISFTNSYTQTSKREMGNVENFINDITSSNLRAGATIKVPIIGSNDLEIHIEDYYHEGDLSITGKAQDQSNSQFILKYIDGDFYGHLVLHDQKQAYEYVEENNKVVIKAVEIGKIYPDLEVGYPERPFDSFNGPRASPSFGYKGQGPMPHIGTYQGQNINKLQSLPGATKVFYCDITKVMNGDNPKNTTKEEMFKTWQCFSSFLSAYEINVTTDKALYDATPVINTGIMNFVDRDGRSYAPLNAFGTRSSGTLFRIRDGYGYGRICAHEAGHILGLGHDGGNPGGEYFNGFPEFEWTAYMGNVWPGNRWDNAIYHYSKGEYNTATNRQDDLSIISTKYLPYRKDDIPTSKPIEFEPNSNKVSMEKNWGHIERTTDEDVFTFQVNSGEGDKGHVKLKITPMEYVSLLDVEAEIKGEGGNSIAKSNVKVKRHAEFDQELPSGKYQLVIRGGAEGTPQRGFSNYSSLGVYGIEGEISGAVITKVATNSMDNLIFVGPNPSNGIIQFSYPSNFELENIRLRSSIGQEVEFSRNGNRALDIFNLPSGIYFMEMNFTQGKAIKKIIKK